MEPFIFIKIWSPLRDSNPQQTESKSASTASCDKRGGTRGGIRTHTLHDLNVLPLPVGLREHGDIGGNRTHIEQVLQTSPFSSIGYDAINGCGFSNHLFQKHVMECGYKPRLDHAVQVKTRQTSKPFASKCPLPRLVGLRGLEPPRYCDFPTVPQTVACCQFRHKPIY